MQSLVCLRYTNGREANFMVLPFDDPFQSDDTNKIVAGYYAQIAAINAKKKKKAAVTPVSATPTVQTVTKKVTDWFYTTETNGKTTVNYVHIIIGAIGAIIVLAIIRKVLHR